MAHSVQNVRLALTLPITCHICLGKVRQPVICSNYHVFCTVCIELWLKNSSQCPACRVPITQENPCKNIIGGTSEDEGPMTPSGRKQLRKTRLELLQKEYEDEIESLFKETEELKRANLRLQERLGEATNPTAVSEACHCRNKKTEDTGGISDRLLEEWSRNLKLVNAANKKVVEDIERLKEENHKLKNENIECVRENLRLKNEVDLRSPQKFGRFTVAALQAKVDQYEREMNRLKKALERSDQYREELEAQVEQLKRPPEDIQKNPHQCGNAGHAHITDVMQQFLSCNQKTGVCSEEFNSLCLNLNGHSSCLNRQKSLCETVGSLELKGKSSSSLLNSSEQMSVVGNSQREGAKLALGFGSPTSLLPFSSLHLNTPGKKGNGSSSHAELKKPLTYLRRLVFDDLPKKKELCLSNSSMCENNMNTGEGLECFRKPKPNFLNLCQINYKSRNCTLTGQRDTGLQLIKQKDNAMEQRDKQSDKSQAFVENSIDDYCHDTVNKSESSLQAEEEVIFHSASKEAEYTGHASQSMCLSQCNPQPYINSPPAKRKLLDHASDSPSISSKP